MNKTTAVGQTHVHEYFFPTIAGRNYAKYYWTGSAWETHYMHGNPLDSTQVVMRSDNSYLEAEVFYPFGGKRWRGGGAQDVRFAGMQERDMETELWQDPLDPTPNRMYTSGLGRWLTPDPAGVNAVDLADPQTWNMYAYARNNPTTLGDPSGLLAIAMAEYEVGTGLIASEEEAGERSELEARDGKGQNENQPKYDPAKSGPEDPTNPGKPLSQNPVVQEASDQAFMKTTNGTARGGLAEAGFSVEYKDGKISIANKVDSLHSDKPANELKITTDENTIAILHTHGNNALPTPSPGDRNPNSRIPDFVRSQSALYVTVPHTRNYIQLLPAPSN